MDNLIGLLGIRRIDRVLNAWIRKLCGGTKGIDEMIEECVLWWFRHLKRMERDRIAERVYGGECAGIRSVCRLWKRWNDTMKDCLTKRGLDVRQARRMVRVCEGEGMRRSPENDPSP